MKNIFLCILCALTIITLENHAETVTLTMAWELQEDGDFGGSSFQTTKASRSIAVAKGQTAKVLHFYSFKRSNDNSENSGSEKILPSLVGVLEIKISEIPFPYNHATLFGDFSEFGNPSTGAGPAPSTTVVGPATIQLRPAKNITPGFFDFDERSGGALCTIEVSGAVQIIENEEGPAFKPAQAAEIKADSDGPVSVALESSVDMKESWQTAEPGTYGESEDERFFRIRIEKE